MPKRTSLENEKAQDISLILVRSRSSLDGLRDLLGEDSLRLEQPVRPDASIAEMDSEPPGSRVLKRHDDDERERGRNDEEGDQDDEELVKKKKRKPDQIEAELP